MPIVAVDTSQKDMYNAVVTHPLQAYEWGEFRKKTGIRVIRRGVIKHNSSKLIDGFQLTIHPIPRTDRTIGYLPKGNNPTDEIIEELIKIGREENCVFIQLEPNIKASQGLTTLVRNEVVPAAHPLFTKYTFVLDLTKSEEDLLRSMHPKTRYNIKVATKHGVLVREENTKEAFERYWELTEETTRRQKFYAHSKQYHKDQWEVLQTAGKEKKDHNSLTSHLLTARFDGKILTTMLFFVFHDTLYYPYGASSSEARNTMHSVLTMWEGIRFGKKLGLKTFDMWGSLSENPDTNDPWFGFHRFKQGFAPELIEFVGSYDLIINPTAYRFYKLADKLRWMYLKLKK